MSIREKLIRALGGVTRSELAEAVTDARESALALVDSVNRHYDEREYVRLTQPMFEQFRKLVTAGNNTMTNNTTELQAGHIIGVNHALNVLRDGFVIDSTSAAKPV